jgi:hypothetical protein
LLPAAQLAINNSVHEASGHTPFYLMFGRNAWLPGTPKKQLTVKTVEEWSHELATALSRAKQCLLAAQARQKSIYDRGHRPVLYEPGDRVLLNTKHLKFKGPNCKKLMPRWCGPLTIEKAVGSNAYKLALPPNMNIHPVFHVVCLKPYKDTGSVVLPPSAEVVAEEYPVEAVLKHQTRGSKRRGNFQYLVKWQGLGPDWNSWVDEHELNCPKEMAIYWSKRPQSEVPDKYNDILTDLADGALI